MDRTNPHIIASSETQAEYRTKMTWIPWDDTNHVALPLIETVSRQAMLVEGGHKPTRRQMQQGETVEAVVLPRAAPIVQLWGYGYYHFILEQMPKILRIAAVDPTMPIITYYKAVGCGINMDFIPGVLAAFRIRNPIVSYTPGLMYAIEHPLDTTDILCGIPAPADVESLRSHPAIAQLRSNTQPNIGIVIKRSRHLRSNVNHVAILAAMKQARPDLEWIEFDAMSFVNTVKLFSRAAVIVAPHGAGLANMVWAGNGTRVIEIGSHMVPNICYWHLSEVLGNKHTIILSDQSIYGEFTVDAAAVVAAL
jgi:hypothetical protein